MAARTFGEAVRLLNGLQANHATLEALKKAGARLNLRSLPEMRVYLQRMGYAAADLDALNVIHVAGTKGKGSTCAFVESLLRAAGLRTGLYTSPHLVSVRERIQLFGKPLSADAFTRYFFETWDRVQPRGPARAEDGLSEDDAPPHPSYFRFLTLMSFHVFLQEKVDVAILEVGIGGSFDATNVIERPTVCGITLLGIDHTDVLGPTLESIAHHKAGIMKAGVPCFTVPQAPSAQGVLVERARELGAASLEVIEPAQLGEAQVSLYGAHQRTNAALAVALARRWLADKRPSVDLPAATIATALSRTVWPGRCQVLDVPARRQRFYLDGAHTTDSIAACVSWFESTRRAAAVARPVTLLFNCTHDRDPAQLLGLLMPRAAAWGIRRAIFCPNVSAPKQSAQSETLDHSLAPALTTQEAMRELWRSALPDIPAQVCASVDEALRCADGDSDVLVTGSLLLCGVVLGILAEVDGVDPFATPS